MRRGVARPALLATLVLFSGAIFFLATQSWLRSAPMAIAVAEPTPTCGMVGMLVNREPTEEGYFRIARVVRGMPAQAAGIRAGDRITAVDGQPVASQSIQSVVDEIVGEPETAVDLTVAREGEAEPIQFHLHRQAVPHCCLMEWDWE
jgi:membrane-associated protease RseP (regulator of RpoE activity)